MPALRLEEPAEQRHAADRHAGRAPDAAGRGAPGGGPAGHGDNAGPGALDGPALFFIIEIIILFF